MADLDRPSETPASLSGLPITSRDTPSAGIDSSSHDSDRKTTRFLILAMLFFVTGFLGLPVLWISRSFSLTEKIVWSLLNTIYTCALIAGTIAICIWALKPFFSSWLF